MYVHELMFQMAILVYKENTCEKLFWNPCIYVGQKKLIYVTFKCDLDIQPT